MRMNRKAALMMGASFGVAFLAACSDSPVSPSAKVPSTPSLAVGDAATSTPVPGKLIVCKAGNIGGDFTVTRTSGSGAFDDNGLHLEPGQCVVVAEDNSPQGFGSVFRVHEVAAANVTYVVSGQAIEIGFPPTALVGPTDNQDFFINSIHGIRVTYTNTFTPPVSGCTFTQGYYKNHESVVVQLLSTNGGFVVGGKLVLSQDGTLALTAAQIDDNLQTAPKGGDAFLILTHQLITAELNVKGGASTPTDVANAITAARLLLNGGITAGEEDQAKALADTLDAFNNGLTGPGHCD